LASRPDDDKIMALRRRPEGRGRGLGRCLFYEAEAKVLGSKPKETTIML